jgi:hypothetical protein
VEGHPNVGSHGKILYGLHFILFYFIIIFMSLASITLCGRQPRCVGVVWQEEALGGVSVGRS